MSSHFHVRNGNGGDNPIVILPPANRHSGHDRHNNDDGGHLVQHDDGDDIAVIGLDLRFPQDASTPEGFWKMMEERRSAMTDFPPDRLNVDAFHDPSSRAGNLRMRGGHFLTGDLGAFDADFFSIHPSEASAMDPQQRILLETAYRAFENAGIRMENLKGSDTSVVTGCFTNDYFTQLLKDPEDVPTYMALGTTMSMLANRLSWFFDLAGPSFNVDGACASSAMAVQHACEQLQRGDCNMALVAGSNLMLDPDFSLALGKMQFNSPESRSYAFDSRANGYARGEGVAVVLLKRVADAVRDNDTIRAVIRAYRSNQDGRTPGITQPSSLAQSHLIEETYRRSGLSKEHTRFVEAHGTGTAVGDPTEANAIIEAFRRLRSTEDPLFIGAVKTYIGHLEGAAGIAALIKSIMILESGIILPNINFERLNPQIYDPDSCVVFPTSSTPWPPCFIRRASMSSFGYGGTNCHIIVDDAFSYLRDRRLAGNHNTNTKSILSFPISISGSEWSSPEFLPKHEELPILQSKQQLLLWSANDEPSLDRSIHSWKEYLSSRRQGDNEEGGHSMRDAAYTLGLRRSVLPWRSFAVVDDVSKLADMSIAHSPASKRKPSLAFVFTGQGAQWPTMGRELLSFEPFAAVIEDATLLMLSLGCSWSAKEELLKEDGDSRVNDPEIAQPLTAIVQIGLVELLRTAGVSPVAVVGHSMGEIAAAYCAGLLTQESAVKLAYYRGLFVATIPDRDTVKGGMLAVGLSSEQIIPYFRRITSKKAKYDLSASCINSPSNITVSGEEHQLEELRELLQADGIFARRLRVSAAYHSHQLDQIAADCLAHFKNVSFSAGQMNAHMISTVTGLPVKQKDVSRPEYWVENMISPVLFEQAISRLCAQSEDALTKKIDGSHREAIVVDYIVEIGPASALKMPIQQTVAMLSNKRKIPYSSPLLRKQPADRTFLELLGSLFCAGFPVRLNAFLDPESRRDPRPRVLTDAPSYSFNHSRSFWHESAISRGYRLRPFGFTELLGYRARDWRSFMPEWRYRINPSEMSWIGDHAINGTMLYPAAGMIIAAIKGVMQIMANQPPPSSFTLSQVTFLAPIVFANPTETVETRCVLQPLISSPSEDPKDSWSFFISSLSDGEWKRHCSGIIRAHQNQDYQAAWHLSDLLPELVLSSQECQKVVSGSDLYRSWRKQGSMYGNTFQRIHQAWYSDHTTERAVASIVLPTTANTGVNSSVLSSLHPGTLDSILQTLLVALSQGGESLVSGYVVKGLDKLWISACSPEYLGSSIRVSSQVSSRTPRDSSGSMFALNEAQDRVFMTVDGIKIVALDSSTAEPKPSLHDIGHCLALQTEVDPELLTSENVSYHLEAVCGPEVEGPSELFTRRRNIILDAVREFQGKFQRSETMPEHKHLQMYHYWLDQISKSSKMNVVLEDEAGYSNPIDIMQEPAMEVVKEAIANASGIFHDKDSSNCFPTYSELLERFNEQNSYGSVYYAKLRTYLGWYAFKKPDMDILEIGAGSGSFTNHVLRALDLPESSGRGAFNSYTYTDIIEEFFVDAKARYDTYGEKFVFKTFDADIDPNEQGFEQARYDVIVASHVLHLCKDLRLTLYFIQKLLKPGGKLILHENTQPDMIESGFMFGIFPEWWRYPVNGQTLGPLRTPSAWNSHLLASGFSGSELSIPDFASDSCHFNDIIISTAVGQPRTAAKTEAVLILIDPTSSGQRSLACKLFDACQTLHRGAVRICTLHDSASATNGSKILISLLEYDSPLFPKLGDISFSQLRSSLQLSQKILWVTRGSSCIQEPGYGMAKGFFKVFRLENATKKAATLELDDSIKQDSTALQMILRILPKLGDQAANLEEEYIVKNGAICVSRYVTDITTTREVTALLQGEIVNEQPLAQCRPFEIKSVPDQSLGQMTVCDAPSDSNILKDRMAEVSVTTMSLTTPTASSDKDDFTSGYARRAYAGRIGHRVESTHFRPEDRVCFFGSKGLSSNPQVPPTHLAKMPDDLSMADAVTALEDGHLALHIVKNLARLTQRQTALIHGPRSLLKSLLVTFALEICSMVYVAANTVEERDRLEQVYGQHRIKVIYQRDLTGSFRRLGNVRVDLLVDLSGKPLSQELISCLSPFGQMINVTTGPLSIQASPILPPNISLRTVDRNAIQHESYDPEEVSAQSLLDRILRFSPDFTETQTFPVSRIQDARSIVTSNGLLSRVVLEFKEDDILPYKRLVKPEYKLDASASYLIAGGLGDLGRCIARWLVSRGARHLILLSRSGPRSEHATQLLTDLRQEGVSVFTPACDISSITSLATILERCANEMPPIRGCIQASGAIKLDDWYTAVKPKVDGSWNLHSLLPADLDFFIMTSSISGVLGQPTQINYAAANAFQDTLAQYRISLGMKTVSLDLGILLIGGLMSQNPDLLDRLLASGHYNAFSEQQIMGLFEHYCDPAVPVTDLTQAQVITGIRRPADILRSAANTDLPEPMQAASWSLLRSSSSSLLSSSLSSGPDASGGHADVRGPAQQLEAAGTMGEMQDIVMDSLTRRIARSLALGGAQQASVVDVDRPLHTYGADSLSAIELRAWILRTFTVDLPVFDLLGDSSIADTAKVITMLWLESNGKSR